MICTEIFSDPQVLPCEHVFCKTCVKRMTDGGTLKCPNCSKVCMADDIKPDFRLANFLDVLATNTENLTKPPGTSGHDVTEKHVTPPADDECELCEENAIDSFCHQCRQWFCTKCKKMHGKLNATKDHTYAAMAEKTFQLKTDLMENIRLLKQNIEELNIGTKRYETAIKELEKTQKNALQKSKVLRKAFHETVEKYFDAVDDRIARFCSRDYTIFKDKNHDSIKKAKACVDLIENMDKLVAEPNSCKLLAQGDKLLIRAKELSKSLTSLSTDAVEIPKVRLECGQDWSLAGAVNLHLQRVQHTVGVLVMQL